MHHIAPMVAVLGSGIMGCSTALALSEKGIRSQVFEQHDRPMLGASRWNEGKIHLGYLYAASQSLSTARRVIPGGLKFKPIIERWLGFSILPWVSQSDESYLIHRDSVISPAETLSYFQEVDVIVSEHPDRDEYVGPLGGVRSTSIPPDELAAICDTRLVSSGWHVPERSVNTVRLADALTDRILQEPMIEFLPGHRVEDVLDHTGKSGPRWFVQTDQGRTGSFDVVVNALWEGRPRIDLSVLGAPDAVIHHRFRVSAFVRTSRKLDLPSAVISAGPFGDVKCYDGFNFYVSWYPAGLLAEGDDVVPPDIQQLESADEARILGKIHAGLGSVLPWIERIFDSAEQVKIAGGWVYAQGSGRLDELGSSLHHRALMGVRHRGHYFSIDTGKYSVAPGLAEGVAAAIQRTRY